ncbi:hypothetical protein ACFQ3Z_16030 [Streptomyces nogalater]
MTSSRQPAAEVGVPAEDVAKTTDTTTDDAAPADGDDVTKTTDTDSDDILKSSDIRELVKGLLDEHSADQTAQLTKTGEAVVELASIVETLKGRLETLEEQPAEPKVFAKEPSRRPACCAARTPERPRSTWPRPANSSGPSTPVPPPSRTRPRSRCRRAPSPLSRRFTSGAPKRPPLPEPRTPGRVTRRGSCMPRRHP